MRNLHIGKSDSILLFEVEYQKLEGDIVINLIKNICKENNLDYNNVMWNIYDTNVIVSSSSQDCELKKSSNKKSEFINHLTQTDKK